MAGPPARAHAVVADIEVLYRKRNTLLRLTANSIGVSPFSRVIRTNALSSRFDFMTRAGGQGGRFIARLRHASNAHLLGGSENLREAMLLASRRR